MSRRLALAAAFAALSGCAALPPRAARKIRVAVRPVQIAVKIKHLRAIQTFPKAAKAPLDEAELIREGLSAAAGTITLDLEGALAASGGFEVVADSDARKEAVLETDLAGYGSIKRRWLAILIGTGLAEGLAEGIAAAAIVHSPWAAVGIGAEEAAQEAAEWGGGAWLFGRVWTPVILEARLRRVSDGRLLWKKTVLESRHAKALKAISKEERSRREVRLRVTAQLAAEKLVQKLDRKASVILKSL